MRTLLLALLLLASMSHAATVRVAAAISLREALTDLASAYQATTGDTLEFTFGSSGQLASQIKAGGAIDLFIAAADQQADDLIAAKLADPASRRLVATNHLVLITPADAPPLAGFADLEKLNGRLAVGEPKTVPAGAYAMDVLEYLNLSATLADKLVYGTNVRQVLSYVERGEAAAGLVYATDAQAAGDKVRVVATADAAWHKPINYPGVVVTSSDRKADAAKLLDYLASDAGRKILAARGFGPATAPPATAPAAAHQPRAVNVFSHGTGYQPASSLDLDGLLARATPAHRVGPRDE